MFQKLFRLTLQVTDVLSVAGIAPQFQQPTKCGGRKQHKGTKCRLLFSGTRGREQRPQQLPFVKRSNFAFIFHMFTFFI